MIRGRGLPEDILPGGVVHNVGALPAGGLEVVDVGRTGEITAQEGGIFDLFHGVKIGDISYLSSSLVWYTGKSEGEKSPVSPVGEHIIFFGEVQEHE